MRATFRILSFSPYQPSIPRGSHAKHARPAVRSVTRNSATIISAAVFFAFCILAVPQSAAKSSRAEYSQQWKAERRAERQVKRRAERQAAKQADTSGATDAIPLAANDSAIIPKNTGVSINVLSNDNGMHDTPLDVQVHSSPVHGTATMNGNDISYRPDPDYAGQDSFTYKVSDSDGDITTASVSVTVECPDCPVDQSLTLTWDTVAGEIHGYRVFRGDTATTATELVGEVVTAYVSFNTYTDLELQSGDSICFRVRAYNLTGESDYSRAVCGSL